MNGQQSSETGSIADASGSIADSLLGAGGRIRLVVSRTDGRVRHASSAAQRRIGPRRATTGRRIDSFFIALDANRLRAALATPHRSTLANVTMVTADGSPVETSISIDPMSGDGEGLALVQIDPLGSTGRRMGADLEPDGLYHRVLHEVRNLIFPLVGRIDLAMASLDDGSQAYRSLMEARSACRRCEASLTEINAITRPDRSMSPFCHVGDVLTRARLVLHYTLPKGTFVEVARKQYDGIVGLPITRAQAALVALAREVVALRGLDGRVTLDAIQAEDRTSVRFDVTVSGKAEVEITAEGESGLLQEIAAVARDAEALRFEASINEDEVKVAIELPPGPTFTRVARGDELRGTERMVIVHGNPMMRDIVVNYLSSRDYRVRALSSAAGVESLLDKDPDIDGVVVDVEGQSPADLARLVELHDAKTFRGLVVCEKDLEAAALPGVTMLRGPYRMDELAGAIRHSFSPES